MTWQGDARTTTPEWRRTRRRVLRRDRGICWVCGKAGADEVDHVIPRAEGGTDDEDNLAAIHDDPCHRRKSAAEGARARYRFKRKRDDEPHPAVVARGRGMTPSGVPGKPRQA